jgi:hypothetical protein
MNGIAGRMIQQATPAATCPAAVRIAFETTDEGLREVTSQTALQTMYDIALPTKDEAALLTMDEATIRTISRTVRRVVPQVGESIRRPQA